MGIEEQAQDQGAEQDDLDLQEGAESEDVGDQQQDDGEGEQEEGVVVTIGDEEPPEEQDDKAAPAWVKELRKQHRELQRENRELKAKVVDVAPKPKTIEVGREPALTDDDIDYDPDKYKAAYSAWHQRKLQADKAQQEQEQEQQAQQKAWQEKLDAYSTARGALKVKDYEDAEGVVQGSLNVTQQGIIIQGADNPALVVYALGKNPGKAKELAGINDPVKFAFAIAKLETQLKVQNRKAPPAPERTVSGSGKISGAVDSNLDRLRAEAEKTGDMSKVIAYKRKLKEKGKG